MKKTYINPEMEIVKIQTLSLMVGSPDAKINNDDTVDAEEVEASEYFDLEEEGTGLNW